MASIRISIDEEFADYLLDLYRYTWEAATEPEPDEQVKMLERFQNSVHSAKRLTKRAADLRRIRAKIKQIENGASR